MTTTGSLGLNLFEPEYGKSGSTLDLDEGFETYRMALSGCTTSNMTIVDDWGGAVTVLLAGITSNASGSLTNFSNFYTNASGSLVNSRSGSAEYATRFLKLGTFSGSGQADFDSISQSFRHILIIGNASVNCTGCLANIGCDFNGITASGSYIALQWSKTGSALSGSSNTVNTTGSEVFNSSVQTSQITLALTSGSDTYGTGNKGVFFAVIPNYSGSSGSSTEFYKTASSFSTMIGTDIYDSRWMSLATQGGYCTITDPITRVRIFGSATSGSTRYNLINSSIDMYGIY